jgi:hypothetical protein
MERIERNLLPKLGFVVTDDQLNCVPGQARLAEVALEVAALRKVPSPDDAPE